MFGEIYTLKSLIYGPSFARALSCFCTRAAERQNGSSDADSEEKQKWKIPFWTWTVCVCLIFKLAFIIHSWNAVCEAEGKVSRNFSSRIHSYLLYLARWKIKFCRPSRPKWAFARKRRRVRCQSEFQEQSSVQLKCENDCTSNRWRRTEIIIPGCWCMYEVGLEISQRC